MVPIMALIAAVPTFSHVVPLQGTLRPQCSKSHGHFMSGLSARLRSHVTFRIPFHLGHSTSLLRARPLPRTIADSLASAIQCYRSMVLGRFGQVSRKALLQALAVRPALQPLLPCAPQFYAAPSAYAWREDGGCARVRCGKARVGNRESR